VQTKLSDLYFLDPEWLCMLMGQIITIKQVNAFTKDGVSLMIIALDITLRRFLTFFS
jgi:hypothetical protein